MSVYNEPLLDLTIPVPKELRVVEPLTVRVPVRLVVAVLDTPLTHRGPDTVMAVDDAVAKKVWSLTHNWPLKDRAVPEATPSMGVIKVGEVCKTLRPVPVLAVTNKAPPEVDWTLPAPREDRVVEPLAVTVR